MRDIRMVDIDDDAIQIIRRLTRHDHVAYLVGGCVRDLLLGRRPKDFDISTSARPNQVRRLFRNSRVIGRRFQLVHIFFRGPGGRAEKIIEVSTFRAYHGGNNDQDDLLITRDNVFGTPEEDTLRRDFTVNSLFYDIQRREVIDHLGGVKDLRRGIIRTVGDPDIRLREDPIRILRAIKFAARLGFEIEPATLEALRAHRWDIQRAAAPRTLEEILRILRSGAALSAFSLLGETRTLEVLLPEIDGALHRDESLVEVYFGVLGELDRRVAAGEELSNAVVLASLLLPLTPWPAGDPQRSFAQVRSAALELLESVFQRLRVSRRDSESARQLLLSIRKMAPGFQARRFSRTALAQRPYFPELLTVFSIHCRALRRWTEVLQAWEELLQPAERTPGPPRPGSGPGGVDGGGGRRRRRRRGGRSRHTPVGSRASGTRS
ncbi:MAG: polynucleotide adenylyltransferase PcnB [Acidobacteria bacterium]|nr:polynucleotide adenylyltransferase PcnB [Acidobacteriota bacterium]